MISKTISLPSTKLDIENILSSFTDLYNGKFSKLLSKVNYFLASISSFIKEKTVNETSRDARVGFNKEKDMSKKRNYKKYIIYLLVLVFIYLLIIGGSKVIGNIKIKEPKKDKVELQAARSTQTLEKEFNIPLRDNAGEEIANLNYTIDNAEIRDEIIVKGKQAKSVKGRTFLILNIKVKNEFTQSIKISTKDYVRLSVNGNEQEWFAPDIHNDPVEVQAISTEPTRLGFAINETDSNMVIAVGEINGEKERIELDIK